MGMHGQYAELFSGLKKTNPKVLEKLIAVPGDTTQLGLGISQKDKHLLLSKLDVIYNCAASVRFDQPLKDATITNVRSSRELCSFALECKQLKVLVHVSTAYSNIHTDVIEEKTYPQLIKWQDLIEIAENENLKGDLEIITEKFLGLYPNTYAFTKQVSEGVFEEMCCNKIPLIIYRPSIVICCLNEPIVGWCDNMNGPFSLCIPTMKGLCDVILIRKKDSVLDMMFADNAIKTLIISVWLKCSQQSVPVKFDVSIYNACSEMYWKLSDFEMVFNYLRWTVPLENRIWLPEEKFAISFTSTYYIRLIFFNVLPSIVIDSILKLSGRKPMVFKILKKLYIANVMLDYFMKKSFLFKTENYLDLENHLLDCDKSQFKYRTFIDDNNKLPTSKLMITGVKQFVLREKMPIQTHTFENTYRLYYMDMILKSLKLFLLIYVLFWKLDIISYVY